MSNQMTKAESSKEAKKRKLKERGAILAALRNSSNAGIHISEKPNSKKKKKKGVKGATRRSKMSEMANRGSNDVDPTDEDFISAEEDAHDFNEDDETVPKSYSRDKENPSSKESHKSKKVGGSTKAKSSKKVEKRSGIKWNSSHDSSDEDFNDEDNCRDENGSKGNVNRAKSKGPLIEEGSEGDSSDEDDAIDSDAESKSDHEESENDHAGDPSSKESHRSRKTSRSRCRPKVMATDSGCKLTMTFNTNGQPVGENSDKFSSYLGSIASEMVPLTFNDWRSINKGYKDLYWQTVLQKFILDEGRRTYTLQQIGRLWRAHKSRLREKIRLYTKKKKDIALLKPTDCGLPEWEVFLKQMSRKKFILKSQRFQEMREIQEHPHTCSRQGYARLEYQMQKESPNPLSITRVDVWCKGHTKKSGQPSNSTVAEAMKKMKEIRDSAASDSFNHSIQNDALSQVLGPDRYSRVRGKGAGVTPSKLGVVSQEKQMVIQLQEEVLTVKKDLAQIANLVNTQNELIRNLLASTLGGGTNGQEVIQSIAQTTSLSQGQGIGGGDQGIQTTLLQDQGIGSNDQGIQTSTPSTTLPQAHGRQCKLLNWAAPHELLAKGRWESEDPIKPVHGVPLGDGASKVWVQEVVNSKPRLWRENSELQTMGDAKGTAIAWPTKYVIFDCHAK